MCTVLSLEQADCFTWLYTVKGFLARLWNCSLIPNTYRACKQVQFCSFSNWLYTCTPSKKCLVGLDLKTISYSCNTYTCLQYNSCGCHIILIVPWTFTVFAFVAVVQCMTQCVFCHYSSHMTFLFAEVAVGNNKLIGYLFTLGEVAQVCVQPSPVITTKKTIFMSCFLHVPHFQLCPTHTSSHVCYIVQSLLLASTECEG